VKPELLKSWSLEIDYSRALCDTLGADHEDMWALGTRLLLECCFEPGHCFIVPVILYMYLFVELQKYCCL